MAETPATAFRLTDEDLAALALVQEHTGIRSRTEAIRMLIRYYARAVKLERPQE